MILTDADRNLCMGSGELLPCPFCGHKYPISSGEPTENKQQETFAACAKWNWLAAKSDDNKEGHAHIIERKGMPDLTVLKPWSTPAPGDSMIGKRLEKDRPRFCPFVMWSIPRMRHLRWVYKGEVQIDGSLLPKMDSLERLNAAWRELCFAMIPTSVYAGAEPNSIAKVIELQRQHDRRFR